MNFAFANAPTFTGSGAKEVPKAKANYLKNQTALPNLTGRLSIQIEESAMSGVATASTSTRFTGKLNSDSTDNDGGYPTDSDLSPSTATRKLFLPLANHLTSICSPTNSSSCT